MPYSIMIWLTDPGTGGDREGPNRETAPGAHSGVTAPPAITHLSYGFFDDEIERDEQLTVISEHLRRNAPLRVTHGERTFLIPAARVHYVVCEKVMRPKDRDRENGPGSGEPASTG